MQSLFGVMSGPVFEIAIGNAQAVTSQLTHLNRTLNTYAPITAQT